MGVEHVQPHRKVQQHFHDEQHDGRRQGLITEGQNQQRNAHVTGIVEHHRWQEGLQVQLQNLGQWIQDNPRSEYNHRGSQCQPGILLQRGLLVCEYGKDQHGNKQLHVEYVQPLDVGRPIATVQGAATGDEEYRQHGGQDLANH